MLVLVATKDCFQVLFIPGLYLCVRLNASCIFILSGLKDSSFSCWDHYASKILKLTQEEIDGIRGSFQTNRECMDHVLRLAFKKLST